ncbi:ornithine decarboxylase antizyme-domain-containing protein [Parachaetomium inaequale]|uniref:Ornithine decarboxylase antizyme n=1 Tax=Parachaetomium inaequale TaxID=2588326 RepID=A0AAN6PFX5_9PEZI|nr:ornithine decarboxylase antizyme-domain-containing protein [Parachaetomium inaequale]
MAPMKSPKSNHSSSNYGEDFARQANILASCYIGPSGIPEVPSTGLPSPPSSPPLAALTTTNQLALTPKARSSSTRAHGVGRHGPGTATDTNSSAWHRRRGGATLRIREECERFFCEPLRAMLLGERNVALQGSGLASVYNDNHNYNSNDNNSYNNSISNNASRNDGRAQAVGHHGQLTPPDDFPIADETMMGRRRLGARGGVLGWLEIWDYAGGSSFRGFVAEDATRETKSLFVFFDAHSITRDLKQALVALIELAEGPLACSHMVICIERSIPEEETKGLTKGLQWAGFSLTTLDFWSPGFDVVSNRWLFMGMEV